MKKSIATFILLLAITPMNAWGRACNGCLGDYFTTSNPSTDVSTNANNIGVAGSPSTNASPCVDVGTYNMGPTDGADYPKADASDGGSALNNAFKNQTNFAVGGYFYFTLTNSTQALISTTDLSTFSSGLYMSNQYPQVWYGTTPSLLTSSVGLAINTCYYIGYSYNGSTISLYATANPQSYTAAVATVSWASGSSQNCTYIQFGRRTDTGGYQLYGYENDVCFFASAESSLPFDVSYGPTPTNTYTPTYTPTPTPSPTYTPSYTLTMTVTPANTYTVVPTSICTPPFNNTAAEPTPIMGWESYDALGAGATTSQLEAQGDAMASNLRAYGWDYMNIDSTNGPYYDVLGNYHYGSLININTVASHWALEGLKWGFYTDAYQTMCSSTGQGVYGYEYGTALWAAQNGASYYKVDSCGMTNGDLINWVNQWVLNGNAVQNAYQITGNRMIYDICENGVGSPWLGWGAACGGNEWKVTNDTQDTWASTMGNAETAVALYQYAGKGYYNNAGDLTVGMGGLSTTQYTAQRDYWAMIPSPWILQIDMTSMSGTTLGLLTNPRVISVLQDTNCTPGHIVQNYGAHQYTIVRPLANGTYAIFLFNGTGSTASLTTTWSTWSAYAQTGTLYLTNADTGANLGAFTGSYTASSMPATSGVLLIAQAGPGCPPTPTAVATSTLIPTVTPVVATNTPTITPSQTPSAPPKDLLALYWSNQINPSLQNSYLNQAYPNDVNSQVSAYPVNINFVSGGSCSGTYSTQGFTGCCVDIGPGTNPNNVLIAPTIRTEVSFRITSLSGTSPLYSYVDTTTGTEWSFGVLSTGAPYLIYGNNVQVNGTSGTFSAGVCYTVDVVAGAAGNYVYYNGSVIITGSAYAFPFGNFFNNYCQIGRDAGNGNTCTNCQITNFAVYDDAPATLPSTQWFSWTATITPTQSPVCLGSPTITPTLTPSPSCTVTATASPTIALTATPTPTITPYLPCLPY